MRLSVTGHRPAKLGGYSRTIFRRAVDLARAALPRFAPDRVYTGMALGWDLAVAQACVDLGLPYVACVPFDDQEARWTSADRDLHARLLCLAQEIVVVSPGGYSAAKLQRRNEYLVDHADQMLALWDGSPGGTANCIAYARARHIPIANLWNSWSKYKDVQPDKPDQL